jgi:hypothetical protein
MRMPRKEVVEQLAESGIAADAPAMTTVSVSAVIARAPFPTVLMYCVEDPRSPGRRATYMRDL